MQLRLILAILWVTTVHVSAQTITNCLHDGYLNNSVCTCRKGFSSSQCQSRSCFNDGQPNPLSGSPDFGCTCPSGFLGSNCEPTKCTTGEGMFYEDVTDQTISMYITQNNGLLNDTLTDPTIATICQFFNNGTQYKQLQFTLGDPTIVTVKSTSNCATQYNEMVFGDEDDPDDYVGDITNHTDLYSVETLLDATSPNSLYFLIVNYPADNSTLDALPRIVRKAVSKRIRIHVIAYRIPYIISDYHEYVNPNNTGYQALRILAESTLGSFITPYWGTSHTTLGPDNANTAVEKLLYMRSNGYEPAAIFKTSSPAVFIPSMNIGSANKYYISIRTEDSAYIDSTAPPPLKFSPGPDLNDTSYVTRIDTGYWKLYEINTTTASVPLRLNNADSLNTPVDYIVYTQRPDFFPAVTSSSAIDAAAPCGSLANSNKMLVVHGHSETAISTATVYSSVYSTMNYTVGKATLTTNLTSRNCQFNTYIGDLTCNTEGGIFIQTSLSNGAYSVFPFFCTGDNTNGKMINYAFVEESVEEFLEDEFPEFILDDAETCQILNGPALNLQETNVTRAFTIISRNVRYLVNATVDKIQAQSCSPVDQLYYNPGSIFDYLQTLDNVYSSYYALLLKSGSTGGDTPQTGNDLLTFMNYVMSYTQGADTNSDTQDAPISWSGALKTAVNTIKNNKKMYTDIFMVIDLNTTLSGFFDDVDLFDGLYKTRSRVFFLTVETRGSMQPATFETDDIQKLAKTAAQTGGGLYRFSDFDNLRQFFDIYFKKDGGGLIGSDVVYQKMANTTILNFPTDPVSLPLHLENVTVSYKIVFYGTMNASSISTCNGNINTSTNFGEIQIFDISHLGGQAECNFTVNISPPQSQAVNFMIYATGQSGMLPYNADIGFSGDVATDVNTNGYKLQFGLPAKNRQYPVVSATTTRVQIKNSSNLEIINLSSSSITRRNGCSGFTSFVLYDFRCSNGNDYYTFYTTFTDSKNANHSRAFVTRCQKSAGNSCLNGGTTAGSTDTCVCPIEWTGPICQTPLCQNGGTVQASGTCQCPVTFSGFFCEYANGTTCSNVPVIPDTKSEITSLLFVVEKTNTTFNVNVTQDFPGIQFSVVQFDSSSVETVYLGTEAKKLPAKLTTGTPAQLDQTGLSNNSGLAIIQALDTQLESRALLIYVTQNCADPFGQSKKDIVDRLGSQRVDVRVYSAQTSCDDASNLSLQTLALYGNGIVFQAGDYKSDFTEYFTKYIKSLFPIAVLGNSVATFNAIPRLSVVQTGSITSTGSVSINADSADSTSRTVYVHVSSGLLSETPSSGAILSSKIGSTLNSQILVYKQNTIGKIDFNFTGTGSYSVEKLTTVKLGYGFQKNGSDENIQVGLQKDSTNILSFYSSQSTVNNEMDSGSYPYVIVTEILFNGSLGLDKPYLATRKPSSCMYSYYTEPINCTESTVGYVAKFHTITGGTPAERVEQKVLLCSTVAITPTTSPATTAQATTTQITTSPVTTTQATITSPATTKQATTTQIASGPRAFAFIVDVFGGDPNLYNKVIDTINYFLAAYDSTVQVLFVEQTGALINPDYMSNGPAALAKLNSTAFNDRTQIDINNNTDVTAAISAITANVPAGVTNNRVFFLTQTGVVNKSYDLSSLQANNFTLSAVFYLNTNGTSNTTVKAQSLQSLGLSDDSLLVSNSTADAVSFLERRAGREDSQSPNATPAANRKYSCVKNSQASVFVSIENSNTTGNGVDDAKLTQAIKDFFNYFPSDFELGDQFTYKQYPNTNYDGNGCNVNLDRFDGVTQMSGWAVSGKRISTTPDLCYSNYASVGQYITPNNQPTTSIFFESLATIFFNNTLSQTCKCTRYNNNSVLKIVVWLVYNKPAYDNAKNGTLIDSFTKSNNFLHIVVGFGNAANPVSADFYYQLVATNIDKLKYYPPSPAPDVALNDFLIDGSGYDGKDIVTQVWAVICRLQALIGKGEPVLAPTQKSDAFFARFMQAQANGLVPPDQDPLKDVYFEV